MDSIKNIERQNLNDSLNFIAGQGKGRTVHFAAIRTKDSEMS